MKMTKRMLALFGAAGLMFTTGEVFAQGASAGGADPAAGSGSSAVPSGGMEERTVERTTERTTERKPQSGQQNGASESGAASSANGEVAASQADKRDTKLERKVEQKLDKDKQLSTHDLAVEVMAGTATLRGTVPSTTLKDRAERVASQVKGVKEVENLIEVQTAGNGADGAQGTSGGMQDSNGNGASPRTMPDSTESVPPIDEPTRPEQRTNQPLPGAPSPSDPVQVEPVPGTNGSSSVPRE